MLATYNVNGTVGALLVSLFISTCLFGVSSAQAYLYHTSFSRDRLGWKIMVLTVWLCELAHCLCISHSFFLVAITRWGNTAIATEAFPRSFAFSILLSGVIGTIVQCFFAERIRALSRSIVIPAACWALSFVRAVLVIMATYEAFVTTSVSLFEKQWKWLVVTILTLGSAVDFLLAALLCFYIKQAHISNDYPGTSFVLKRVFYWTLETGLITGLAGILIVICLVAFPRNFSWIAIYTVLVRLFSNSLFASLNGRVMLRDGITSVQFTQSSRGGISAKGHLPLPLYRPTLPRAHLLVTMPPTLTTVDIVLFLAIGITAYALFRKIRAFHPPYPPGPARLPLIGSLLKFPSSFEWITYHRWSKEVGSDIIYLNIAGKEIIVLNSLEVIDDLFDKRSTNYSSRPSLPMTVDLMGYDWLLFFMPYGSPWRERRRQFVQHFRPANSSAYQDSQIQYIREILPRLLDDHEDFIAVSKHAVAASALSMAYGLPIKGTDDPLIDLAEHALSTMNTSVLYSSFLVNVIPFLKHVPEFLPGTGFKAKARQWRKLQEDLLARPFETVLQQMNAGTAQPSLATTLLQRMATDNDQSTWDHERRVIKETAGSIFIDVQRNAQEEIDRVVGGRLPEFSDEKDLPYISAIVKEVLRWQPIGPTSIPRIASADDIYRGYYIPKGAIMIANSWSLLKDPEHYPQPELFNPDRFLKDGKIDMSVRDPVRIAFGNGRRRCPGVHIALSFLWLMTATMLKTFNISKAVDEDGNTIEPSMEFISGFICKPAPFKCSFKPRSAQAEELIRSVEMTPQTGESVQL
ncbi:hypothetical protein D9613_011775 [Agrocybe pediades]|uniref:DUF6534 domain-containing protein n=1 Tax=Agrocybe pediades TaxID=84607 RepID=A0A8H4QKR8_9AGAR|nr:hypothetical protein D9613_011775 [Agrocybe pediades]